MKSPPGPSCVVCSTCGHCSTSLRVGSTPKHPGCVKLSWIIQLGNGFEIKGHLQEEVVCCGCHHLGKGPFTGAGEAGGCAVDFPVVDCLLPNSTVQTLRTLLFPLGGWRCLGWGCTGGFSPFWSRREHDTQLECMVSVVMFEFPCAQGLHRSGIASPPVMGELPEGVPEDAEGSGSAVGWAVPGGHCSHCPVLPAAEQG